MWANVIPLLAKLPLWQLNGRSDAAHGVDWSAGLADLDRYRAYTDDWDGQGAKGIPGELIDGAVSLAELLRSRTVVPPACVLPGFGGTVRFEWDVAGGGSIALEVIGPEAAEFESYTADGAYEALKVGDPVTA